MAAKLRRRLIGKKAGPRLRKDTFDYYDLIIYAARGSNSARALARALKCRRWFENSPDRYKRRRAFFRGRPYPVIVNWGSTVRPAWGTVAEVVAKSDKAGCYLNNTDSVARAINKLETFKCLNAAGVPVLRNTTDKDTAKKWLAKKHQVFARLSVTASGGTGIRVISEVERLPDAPLYTRNYPKTHEFRVHVFDGKVIDFVEKKAKLDANTNAPAVRDRLVRNHDNGWIFAHDNLSCSKDGVAEINRIAVSAVRSLGLLFGGVDILAILDQGNGPRKLKSAVVCEVNTAPGLECTETINAYVNAIRTKHLALRK